VAGRAAFWFGQGAFRCRLAWGRTGAREAADRGDLLVVVDTLSFSTTAAVAVARGALLFPCAPGEEGEIAARIGAEAAVHRTQVPSRGRFSQSPASMGRAAGPGDRIVVGSPNGATCARYGREVPRLFVGALVNAAACAAAVAAEMESAGSGAGVTVLACGERAPAPVTDGEGLRFALEDLLGAGAVLAHLPPALSRSPEARAAEAAFRAAAGDLLDTLRACGSGAELIDRGFPEDVEIAARLNVLTAVPTLAADGDRLEPYASGPSGL
jgi:Phosphosulfolactate phosphohydrolase and related enzymes